MSRRTPIVKDETKDGIVTAVMYLRVSNAESARRNGEVEGYSLPVQRERCIAEAATRGAPICEEFIDPGKTGTTMNRRGLQALLAYVNEHHPAYVIVYKLDRLARDLLDSLLIRRQLEAAGTQLISCSEHFDKTPAGELTLNFMGSVNQYYSSNLREEMKSKMIAKVRSGGTIGKAPPGFLNTISRVNGIEVRSVALDDRAPLMLWAFEEFSTGEWSLTSMAEALKDKGLTTVPTAKYAEKPIPRSTLARLLRNPYYTGIIVYKGVTYDGNHPQLVSQGIVRQGTRRSRCSQRQRKQAASPQSLPEGQCSLRRVWLDTLHHPDRQPARQRIPVLLLPGQLPAVHHLPGAGSAGGTGGELYRG